MTIKYLINTAAFAKDLIINHYSFEKIKLFLCVKNNTMVTHQRMNNMFELTKYCEKNNIKGDYVECGVWKGGVVAICAYVKNKYHSKKNIWLFDSFEGLPEPSRDDGKEAIHYARGKSDGKLVTINKCVSTLNDVKKLFKENNISWNHVIVKKGWFQDTIPKNTIRNIAILRLDGDWYESTKICIDNLYEKIIPNGFLIIDDYYRWKGCKKAIDEYFNKQKITPTYHRIDADSVYVIKE
jgi:hypothetical protein